jgi:hypothetical protein
MFYLIKDGDLSVALVVEFFEIEKEENTYPD